MHIAHGASLQATLAGINMERFALLSETARMRKCAGARVDRWPPAPLVGAIRVCLIVSLAAIASGCATTRELPAITRTETTTPEIQCKAANLSAVVPQNRAREPGLLVTCTGVFESVCSQWDVTERRAETIRRTADPVDWTTLHSPFAWTSAYVASGRSFNWSHDLGAFSKTRKFSWAHAVAPSTKVGFFPFGTDYRDWWMDWSYAAELGGMKSPVLPYTLSGTWVIDALWTATWPLSMIFVSPEHNAEVVGAPFMLPIGVAGDGFCLLFDSVLMVGAIPLDLVNLLVIDTTVPLLYDTVTMSGAGLGDSSCLLALTTADTVWSAVTAVPDVLIGLADAVYPSAQVTNSAITEASQTEPRVVTVAAPPDFTGMRVTFSVGLYMEERSLDANGSAWFPKSRLPAASDAQQAEVLLWDEKHRVVGMPIQIRLPGNR